MYAGVRDAVLNPSLVAGCCCCSIQPG